MRGVSGLTWLARKRVLVDENGTESGGVGAQISVTASVDASGYEMFHGWTPLSFWAVLSECCSGRLLVAVALGLGLVAFGSVSVAPGSSLGSVPFRWGPVQRRKGHRPKKPAVICDHFMSGIPIPSCSMFWDFGSLHQKHRASAGHLVVYFVTGLMVGDPRFPGATILGARFSTYSANHPVSVPPTGSDPGDGFLSGLFWDFGSLYQRRCGVVSDALSRQPSSSSTSLRRLRLGVAAQASGNIASQMFPLLPTLRRQVSRLVAAGVYLPLKDVAASQFVCSRGADNLSSHVSSFGSDLSSTCFEWCCGRWSTP